MQRAPSRRRPAIALAIGLLLVFAAACEPRDPLERARLLQDVSQDFAGTLDLLRPLVEERPDDPEVQFRYGLALIASGQHSLAKWPLRKAMESPEWTTRAGVALADVALLLASWDEAIQVCDRILEREPDQIDALLLRADARVRSRRHYEEALEDAERVLAIDPDNRAALVPKTVALLGLERAEEAAAALEELEGGQREDSLGLHASPALCAARAKFLEEKGELEPAEERYGECLEHFPTDGLVLREATTFFDRTGRPERSEELLRSALSAGPEAFHFRAALYDRLRATAREDEAEALLRAATELDTPEAASQGWFALALYQLEKGGLDESAAAFDRARELDRSGNPELSFAYADALVVAGRGEEALRVADTLTVPAYRSLVRGRVALSSGDPRGALEHFTEANRLWPNNATARYYTAVAAEQLGDFARAIEDYRYSMRIDVQATDAYLRLARLHLAAGRGEAALVALEFQPGARPEEEKAGLLRLEQLARANRPPPQALLAQHAVPERRGAAVAAMARGLRERLGPEKAIEFVRAQSDLDLTDPLHAAALAELLELLVAAGKAGEGVARIEAALSAHPEAAVFHALHGRALAASGAPAGSVRAACDRALERDPAQPLALAELARLEAEAGDSEAALALYERAAEADPRDAAPPRAAAELLARLGRSDAAETRLEALLRDHPHDGRAALALAELRAARGADTDGTRELARRAAAFGAGPEAKALLERLESGATRGGEAG